MRKQIVFGIVLFASLLALVVCTLAVPHLVAQDNATAPTPIPEEARKHFVIGTTLFKDAKTPDDYAQVESEFKQATDLAPRWPDARYNLALSKEAAGDYSGAMADLKLYQQFKLSDTEARTAQDKIYALEAKTEEAAKAQAAAQQAAAIEQGKARDLAEVKQIAETFRGTWYAAYCGIGKTVLEAISRGCTESESQGKNWHDFQNPLSGSPDALQFEIENDGTIKMNGFSSWAACEGDVYGVPISREGIDDIRWEVRPKDGPPREIWRNVSSNGYSEDAHASGTTIVISCTKPLGFGSRNDVPYRYVMWTRTP